MSTTKPLHRCMACVSHDAIVVWRDELELCLSCVYSRLRPLEPGKELSIVLSETGYDFNDFLNDLLFVSGEGGIDG